MEEIRLELDAAVEYNGYIYFAESGIHGLLRLNISSGFTEFLCFFEEEQKADALFRNAYRFGHTAWFVPWMAKHIVCVDLDTLEMEYFDIPCSKVNRRGTGIYPYTVYLTSGRINEKEIFLIPMSNDTLAVIDMERREIASYPGFIKVEREVMGYGTAVGGKIWIAPYAGDRIIIFDYKKGETDEIAWGYDTFEYAGLFYYQGAVWFAPCKADHLLKYNLKQQKFEQIPLGDACRDSGTYGEITYYDHKIWILPEASHKIIIYDLKDKSVKSLRKKQEICFSYPTELRRIDTERGFMLATSRTGYVSIYRDLEQDFENIRVCIGRNNLHQSIHKKYGNAQRNKIANIFRHKIVPENYLGLDNYIALVEADDDLHNESEKSCAGALIWNTLKPRF